MVRFHTDNKGLRSCIVESISLIETMDGYWLVTISNDDITMSQHWVEAREGNELYENLKILTR